MGRVPSIIDVWGYMIGKFFHLLLQIILEVLGELRMRGTTNWAAFTRGLPLVAPGESDTG